MRYDRHLLLKGFDAAHQARLSKSSVLVAGAGGLGSALLLYLAAAGVGHLGIVDFDVVSESNLNRQILYHPGVIDHLKSEEAARRVKELNPDCRLTVLNRKITDDNAVNTLRGFEVVADATDNFATRYALDAACGQLHIPFVYGSAEQWGGQLSVFHYNGAGSYRDLYPDMPEATTQPPGVMGPMPGFIGTRQALEVIKIITGQGEVLAGQLMVYDVLNNRNFVLAIGQ
ncbi:MAG: HesA/MoeB/ThiF family protein [Bacteroidales bacterium]|nr:HesA/MoeB/ThiF family protein [Bacteroidales bacterium]